MRLPPSSGSSVKDTIMGLEITLIGFIFISRNFLPGISVIIGDILVFVGLWVTLSGYYSDKGLDGA